MLVCIGYTFLHLVSESCKWDVGLGPCAVLAMPTVVCITYCAGLRGLIPVSPFTVSLSF